MQGRGISNSHFTQELNIFHIELKVSVNILGLDGIGHAGAHVQAALVTGGGQ